VWRRFAPLVRVMERAADLEAGPPSVLVLAALPLAGGQQNSSAAAGPPRLIHVLPHRRMLLQQRERSEGRVPVTHEVDRRAGWR
jgi:hypothetical protein